MTSNETTTAPAAAKRRKPAPVPASPPLGRIWASIIPDSKPPHKWAYLAEEWVPPDLTVIDRDGAAWLDCGGKPSPRGEPLPRREAGGAGGSPADDPPFPDCRCGHRWALHGLICPGGPCHADVSCGCTEYAVEQPGSPDALDRLAAARADADDEAQRAATEALIRAGAEPADLAELSGDDVDDVEAGDEMPSEVRAMDGGGPDAHLLPPGGPRGAAPVPGVPGDVDDGAVRADDREVMPDEPEAATTRSSNPELESAPRPLAAGEVTVDADAAAEWLAAHPDSDVQPGPVAAEHDSEPEPDDTLTIAITARPDDTIAGTDVIDMGYLSLPGEVQAAIEQAPQPPADPPPAARLRPVRHPRRLPLSRQDRHKARHKGGGK